MTEQAGRFQDDGQPIPSLRNLLSSEGLEFALEAHDGLSARIVERAGFPCLWASGFALSTTLGVRDASEASWTDVIRGVEVIVDSARVPVLVDGDTGHGDFNIARRFTRKLNLIGAAGLCLEDKLYPKTNSFVGSDHTLADVDEFSAKIAACKEYQATPDFCVIGRTEAFIAGLSLDEAIERADAYRLAGADAIMVHSRAPVVDEILAFAEYWENRLPLVIAPTTYGDTPSDVFRAAGVSLVIWSNHTMRAAAAAMSGAAREIRERESVANLRTSITELGEIFRLLEYDELARDRERHGTTSRIAAP